MKKLLVLLSAFCFLLSGHAAITGGPGGGSSLTGSVASISQIITVGNTNWVRLTNGTAARLTGVTGRYPGNGTATWPIFSKIMTFSQPQTFGPGDIIGGTASQATLLKSNSPTEYTTRDANMTSGFSGSAFEVYPRWLRVTEINGAVVSTIDADGTTMVISGNSGYSGSIAWGHADGLHNWNSYLFDMPESIGGTNPFVPAAGTLNSAWGLFNQNQIGSNGPVMVWSSDASEYSLIGRKSKLWIRKPLDMGRQDLTNVNYLQIGFANNLAAHSTNAWLEASQTNGMFGGVFLTQFGGPAASGTERSIYQLMLDTTNIIQEYRNMVSGGNTMIYSNMMHPTGWSQSAKRALTGYDYLISTFPGAAGLQFMTNWLVVTNGNTFTGPLFAGSVNVTTNLYVTNDVTVGATLTVNGAGGRGVIASTYEIGSGQTVLVNGGAAGAAILRDYSAAAPAQLLFGGSTAAFPNLAATNGNFAIINGARNFSNPTNNLRFPGSGSVMLPTNATPTSVTIGTTVADKFFVIKDELGTPYFVPGWLNH